MKKFGLKIIISLALFCEAGVARDSSEAKTGRIQEFKEETVHKKAADDKLRDKVGAEDAAEFEKGKLSEGDVQSSRKRKRSEDESQDELKPALKKKKLSKEEENFIQNLGNAAVGIINKKGITEKGVQQEFRSLLKDNFALESIARYSLGKNFRTLSKTEKEDFLQCFENMLVKFYSSRFSEYKSAKLVVTGSRQKSSKQILVDSKVVMPNKEDISVVWSVYVSKGVLKVYDAIISDVSISNIQRSEFMEKISEKGLKKFLKDFKEKHK